MGLVAAYVAVAAAWTLAPALWAVVAVTVALVAIAAGLELRYGRRAAGLVAGLLPGAVLTGGLFAAYALASWRAG